MPEKYNICGLLVDDRPAVRFSFSKEEKFYDPLHEYSRNFHNGENIPLSFTGSGALDDDYAIIIAECGLPERPYVITHIQVPPPGGVTASAPRSDLERFAVDYMAGALQELNCPSAES
ncbi:hypothetical protein JJV70_10100 [Streptomyces sp. JJ66]|uniref:hypothetical protein n=1 Tax=Streptomyces sp. JJ66 TaxID=2803843 RepID=UPI001C572662|nr:hypothetical protein [Streptomyces sp. JJ66]MBW1602455.1 hypothetical protein [Streptomyces sp. JJ66]